MYILTPLKLSGPCKLREIGMIRGSEERREGIDRKVKGWRSGKREKRVEGERDKSSVHIQIIFT